MFMSTLENNELNELMDDEDEILYSDDELEENEAKAADEDDGVQVEGMAEILSQEVVDSEFEKEFEKAGDSEKLESLGDIGGHSYVAVDTEFTDSELLSLQAVVGLPGNNVFNLIIINKNHEKAIEKATDIYKLENPNVYVAFDTYQPDESLLVRHIFLCLKEKNALHLLKSVTSFYLFFFYSLQDLNYAFGTEFLQPYYTDDKKFISQKRNVQGCLTYEELFQGQTYKFLFKIKDLAGLYSGGLANLAASVDLSKKEGLEEYKEDMGYALTAFTLLFLEYGLNDAQILPLIFDRKIKTFNLILVLLGIVNFVFTVGNFPTTIGTTVSLILKYYFDEVVFKNNKCFQLAVLKGGILDQRHENYKPCYEHFKLLKQFRSLRELQKYANDFPEEFEKMYQDLYKAKGVFIYTPKQYASIRYFVTEWQEKNVALLALCTGGKTNNERPLECLIRYGADVDLAGAYSRMLKRSLYPFGRPRLYSASPNGEPLTLGKFYRKYEKDLQLGMYKVCVSGSLDFCQDLIMSKIPSKSLFTKKPVDNRERSESPTADASLVLLRKEIVNGFITKDLWEIMSRFMSWFFQNRLKKLKRMVCMMKLYIKKA